MYNFIELNYKKNYIFINEFNLTRIHVIVKHIFYILYRYNGNKFIK